METTTILEQLEGWQERLAEDRQGRSLQELRDYLTEKQAVLRRLLDAGASPEEYAVRQKLLTAVGAADSAVLAFWEKHNKE